MLEDVYLLLGFMGYQMLVVWLYHSDVLSI